MANFLAVYQVFVIIMRWMVVLAVLCAMRTSEFHEESRRLAVGSSCDCSALGTRPVNLTRSCGIEHRQVVGMSIVCLYVAHSRPVWS